MHSPVLNTTWMGMSLLFPLYSLSSQFLYPQNFVLNMVRTKSEVKTKNEWTSCRKLVVIIIVPINLTGWSVNTGGMPAHRVRYVGRRRFIGWVGAALDSFVRNALEAWAITYDACTRRDTAFDTPGCAILPADGSSPGAHKFCRAKTTECACAFRDLCNISWHKWLKDAADSFKVNMH